MTTKSLFLTLVLLALGGSLSAQVQPAAPSSTGSITTNAANCNTTNVCVVLHMATSNVGYSITASGTWTGTLAFEQSGDNQGSWTSATTTTANTLYTSALTPGITDVRVRGSAAMTGTAVVTITASGPATLQQITQTGGSSSSSQVGTFTGPSFTPNPWTLTGSISPCTPANEFTQIGQPGFTVDALDGIVCVPVGSTAHQANGVGAYTETFSTATNAVGLYGSGRCMANTTFCWGTNPIASDVAGVSASSVVGEEVDINVLGTPVLAYGIWVNGLQGGASALPVTSTGVRQQLGFNYGVRSVGLNATFAGENGPFTLNYGSQDGFGLIPTQVLLGSDVSGNFYINQTGTTKHAGTVGSLLPPAAAVPTASILVIANATNTASLTSGPFTPSAYTSWIVGIQSFTNAANSVTNVTDSFRSQAYKIGSQAIGGRDVELWIFPCIANANVVNHPDKITVTQSPAAFILYAAWAVANPNCAIPVNTASVQFATGTGTATAVPTITTLTPNEIVMSAIFNGSQLACTQGAGYILDSNTTNFCFQHQVFAPTASTTTAPATFTSQQWWEATVSLQSIQQLGSTQNPWPIATANQYQTGTNCAVNSVSPAACGSAAAGAFVIPTTTTSYTVNTSAITANSVVLLTPRTYTGNLPSAPTCVVPTITAEPVVSAISAGVSFTLAETSTTGQTCWNYLIVN